MLLKLERLSLKKFGMGGYAALYACICLSALMVPLQMCKLPIP